MHAFTRRSAHGLLKKFIAAALSEILKYSTPFVLVIVLQQHMTNTHFTRLIKARDRLREFNFRKLPAPGGNLFHVDVSDDRGNRLIFKMQKEGALWKILDTNLPAWIQESEEKLSSAIEEEIAA